MISDVLIVNKPCGITSHDVIDQIRHITGEKRVGHAGTLDPLASGVLIVLVGRQATKRQAEFMNLDKEYEAELTFGSVSETYDAEGPITQQAGHETLASLNEAELVKTLPQFIGDIQQRPPAYSAIKVNGQPLYKKARQGKITNQDVPPREVTIDNIEIIEFKTGSNDSPPTARFRIACQKGVYIRSLAHDIGQALSVGAYMSGLVRTRIGPYHINQSQTLEQIEKSMA